MSILDHIHILASGADQSKALAGTYNGPMVALSLLMSVLSSYVALEIAGKLSRMHSVENRSLWLWSGAGILGAGIWAMHFIGMIAFELPVPVSYDFFVTAISILPGLLASYLALNIIAHPSNTLLHIIFSGVLFGAGIGAMHYVGMMAMLTEAQMFYRIDLFLLSVVAAVVLAILALSTRAATHRVLGDEHSVIASLIGSVVMGAAIASMHYIAMKATIYFPAETHESMAAMAGGDSGLSIEALAIGTAVISFALGLAVVLASELTPRGREI